MAKPTTIGGYDDKETADCERVLVSLLAGLGPWKTSVFLVGGLTPRYLITKRPPEVRPHAGTQDLDVVVDMQILMETEAYQTLEANLKKMGFERAQTGDKTVSWRWQIRTPNGTTVILEFLTEDAKLGGGKVQELPTKGKVSAINIPHASMVFELHDEKEISADLLDGGGRAVERIRYANLVSFTCLKCLALADRGEPKDAHDLIYCLENQDDIDKAAETFRPFLDQAHPHHQVVATCMEILRRKFVTDEHGEGHVKDGSTKTANFELGDAAGLAEERLVRQREVSAIIARFLRQLSGTK